MSKDDKRVGGNEGTHAPATVEGKIALEAVNKIKRLPRAIMPLDFECTDKEVDRFVCFLNWLSNSYIPKDFQDEFAI